MAAADGRTRARLRVDLAELLRVRDAAAARAELDHALREGGPTGPLTAAALSFARALAPADRLAWLSSLARSDEKTTPAPALVSALAEAQLGADLPRDAALTWLGLARDERVPLHHRRAAARKAARLGDHLPPADAASVAGTAADLAVERSRRGPRAAPREAEATAPAAPAPRPREASRPIPARGRRARPPSPSPWDRALADARAGQASRARRLGEEALRASAPGPELGAKVAALDSALREGGFVKDALRLRRTHLEALTGPAARTALLALAAEAEQAGLTALAAEWRADAGVVVTAARAPAAEPDGPEAHFQSAQRMLARDGEKVDVAAVLAHLEKALGGHPGGDAALALAESLVARISDGEADLARRRLDLLRAAHAAEYGPGAAGATRPAAGRDAGSARRPAGSGGGARGCARRGRAGRADGAGLCTAESFVGGCGDPPGVPASG